MKIVATIANFSAAANIGGNVEYESEIIEIPDEAVPANLKRHISSPKERQWETLSFSLLQEKAND